MSPDEPMSRPGGGMKVVSPATSAIHAGEPEGRPGEPVVAPVVRSSTFHSPLSAGAEAGEPLRYSRYGNNPNQESVAAKIAALEGTEAALALASGMAATAMTLLSVAEQGDHIIASRHLYGATGVLLAEELPRRGIATTFVEPSAPAAWLAALRPRTRVVLIELPTNPTLKVFDIEPARQAADMSPVPARVVPTTSLPQGIAAMLAFSPVGNLDGNAESMAEGAESLVDGEVVTAVRDAAIDGAQVRAGEVMSLLRGKLAASAPTVQEALVALVRAAEPEEGSLVTLYWGGDVTHGDALIAADALASVADGLDVEVVYGGQPHYHYLVSIE